MSGLGRSRLTSVQQLGRGLQQDEQARRRDNALSRLWDDLNSCIRTREQVQPGHRCLTLGCERTEVVMVLFFCLTDSAVSEGDSSV